MRRLRSLVVLGLVALSTVAFAGRALGQQSDKQQELQQQVSEASAAEQSARARLVEAQAERQRLDASFADVSARLAVANDRLAAAQEQVDRLAFTALVLTAKVEVTQKKLGAARHDVRQSAVLLYRQGDGADMMGLLGSTDGSGQLVEGKHYLQRVSDKRQTDARRVTKLQNQLEAQQQDVAAQKEVADSARAAAAQEKDALDQLVAQQQRAREAAAGAVQAENAALGAAVSLHEQADAALQAESDRLAALIQSSGDGPTLGDGTFIRPVPGSVASGFGYRTDPVTGTNAFHSGLDFGASCATPIKAAGTGSVLTVGSSSGGYGNMTLINHGNGMATLYGHQASIIVTPGQSVTQGQVIGYVGSTGKSTGCHLHFEVRVSGNPVDPSGYL